MILFGIRLYCPYLCTVGNKRYLSSFKKYSIMNSIKLCISFKKGRVVENFYVEVVGAYTLVLALRHLDYILVSLSRSLDPFGTKGYITSISDADALSVEPDLVVDVRHL